MNKYENYKEVNLPWIKKIPSHWNIEKINALFSERKEKNLGSHEKFILSVMKDKGVIPYTEKGNVGNKASEKIENYKLVYPDDIVLNCMNMMIGSLGKSEYKGVLSQVYYVLKLINSKCDIDYLSYSFKNKIFYESLRVFGKGILDHRLRVPMETLKYELLPIPNYSEQRQIVKYLDWKIGEIDKLIEIEKQKKVELNELKLNILWNYIFNGERHSEYKKVNSDYINKIPKEWHFIKIKRLFRIKKNIAGELGYNVLSITQQGIKVKDISKNEGQMSSDYSKYQIVEIGDFAMNHMDLLTGYIDISNFDGVTSPDYRVFQKISHNVHSKYFLFMFQLFYKLKIFYKYGKGAANEGRWRLPAIEFLNFEVPLPDIDEQKDIVQIIENKQNTVRIKLEEINQKIVELTSLKQSLISEVVTGQIDVRNVKIPERE